MSALAVVSTSTPTDSTGSTPAATQVQPIEADGNPPRLPRNVVDQLLSTDTVTRSRRALHAAVNDEVRRRLFRLELRPVAIADRHFRDDPKSRSVSYWHWLVSRPSQNQSDKVIRFLTVSSNHPVLTRAASPTNSPL